jgi:hypothetical protein
MKAPPRGNATGLSQHRTAGGRGGWVEIDELYLNNPYYIAPDGEVGQQAFAVIREAIRKEGMVAIGKVVFTSREHIIALEARGKGLLGVTLRYPYEVRSEADYFDRKRGSNVRLLSFIFSDEGPSPPSCDWGRLALWRP